MEEPRNRYIKWAVLVVVAALLVGSVSLLQSTGSNGSSLNEDSQDDVPNQQALIARVFKTNDPGELACCLITFQLM